MEMNEEYCSGLATTNQSNNKTFFLGSSDSIKLVDKSQNKQWQHRNLSNNITLELMELL